MKKYSALRLELAILVVALVALVVVLISVQLGVQAVRNQRAALLSGFQKQASLLMDTLAANAEYEFRLKEDGFLGAEMMPGLRTAMPETTFATISGPDPLSNPYLKPTDQKDFVWASDQKRFSDELHITKNFQIARESVDDDLAMDVREQLQRRIDTDAARDLSPFVDEYRALSSQFRALLLRRDAASRAQADAAYRQVGAVLAVLDSRAKAEFGQVGSLPVFDPNKPLAPTYLFYRPVIFYNRAPLEADTSFYQGLIRLEVRTDALQRQIDKSIPPVIGTVGTAALAALGLGVLGAILVAIVVIRKGSVVED